MAQSFLPIYDERYKPFMRQRAQTFRTILEHLETRGPLDASVGFQIVETGCTRNPSIRTAMDGDGASSVLWDDFLGHVGMGHLWSVDINPTFVETCRGLVDPSRSTVACSDSVSHLMNLSSTVQWKADLVYLDSYDIDWEDPIPSALHHMKELIAVRPLLTKGTLIVVDDHRHPVGKGMLMYDFFEHIEETPLFLDYQVGWVWKW